MRESALTYARERREAHLAMLREWLAIPSISTQPERRTEMARAAAWLAETLGELGWENAAVTPTEGHPIVTADWLHAGPEAPTLLLYGHYDVQPVDPVQEWQSPPFQPTVRGEDLFARGVSDDKGQVLIMILAAAAYLAGSGALPLNVKVLVEGEEEINSPHLAPFIRQRRAALACDAILICDQPMFAPGLPLIMTGLRGSTYLDVTVRGPAQDLHSGTFGGGIENPLNVLVRLLAACQDPETRRILIPGFYDKVQPISPAERDRLAGSPVTEAVAQQLSGAPATAGEAGYSLAERVSIRPTFEIHGVIGGYTEPGKKSVIPAQVTGKISMRLVPDQEPEEIAELVKAYLQELAPPTVTLTAEWLGGSRPAVIDAEDVAVQTAAAAYQAGLGAAPLLMRGGGSLPIVADFQEILGAPVVLMGFGLPDDNTHAPNEKLHLPNFYGGIETIIHYLHLLAKRS